MAGGFLLPAFLSFLTGGQHSGARETKGVGLDRERDDGCWDEMEPVGCHLGDGAGAGEKQWLRRRSVATGPLTGLTVFTVESSLEASFPAACFGGLLFVQGRSLGAIVSALALAASPPKILFISSWKPQGLPPSLLPRCRLSWDLAVRSLPWHFEGLAFFGWPPVQPPRQATGYLAAKASGRGGMDGEREREGYR